MMANWNLTALYSDFDDTYQADIEKLKHLITAYKKLIIERDQKSFKEVIETHLKLQEQMTPLIRSLFAFASLKQSTDVQDTQALTYMSKLQQLLREMTVESVLFTRYLAHADLVELARESQLIKKYYTILIDEQEESKHLLSEKEEVLYSKLSELSSRGYSMIQSLATSQLETEFEGKTITFSELRNLAYDYDQAIRKKAYEVELKAYEKVEDFVALALTNIKREVNIMVELRGYESALEKTLKQSKISKQTLDVMIQAMQESSKYFQEYLLAKATYLGHESGLPFYDLFAPVGKLEKTYTYEEAQKLILDAFYSYSKRLGDFAKKAFKGNWIDVYPKKGKRGGAFCSNQPQIKQAPILTNFTGSLSDVLTLAHELGHGYHGEVIADNDPLHWSYPMPLAETASIFCETIVNEYLLKTFTNPEERLSVLENSLQGDTQVIIDILSRYLFETNLFEKAHGPIDKNVMKTMMIDAQKAAYGKGLDENYLHPYMWLVKGHYYSAGLNYYNFPYAFGLLFAKGLYAQYLKEPDRFLKRYDTLLALTTKEQAEEVARSMNIDITKPEFWTNSLSIIKKDIDEVISLFNQHSKK